MVVVVVVIAVSTARIFDYDCDYDNDNEGIPVSELPQQSTGDRTSGAFHSARTWPQPSARLDPAIDLPQSMRRFPLLPTLIAAGITAALAGCASGPLATVPPLTESEPAASLTVQRSKSLWGAPASMLFSIDERRVYALRWGRQFSFLIDPGEYRFGYDLGFNSCRQRVLVDPGERYLLRLNPVCQIELMRVGDLR